MRQLVLAVAVLSSVAACGEVIPADTDAAVDAQEIDANPAPCAAAELSVDDFFTCISQRVCSVYEDCIGSASAHIDCENLNLNIFGDLSAAQVKVVIASASAAGRLAWSPTAAAACLALIPEGSCAIFKNNGDPLGSCQAVVGAVNNGNPCQSDLECASPGARCVDRTGGGNRCSGDYVCQAPVAAGQMCTAGNFCQVGDHCIYRNQGGTDLSFCGTGAAGQACDSNSNCDTGNFCNGGQNNGTASGICTVAKAAGSTCATDDECQGELACVGNFSGANGTCRDVRPVGATCDANSFVFSCQGHQTCETPGANMTGTCKAAPGLNQACNVQNGTASWCGVFMSCEGGLCREPGGIGDTCTSSNLFGFGSNPNGCNADLFCDRELTGQASGTCRARQANGSACSSGRHCDSDFCNASGVCATYPACTF